MLQVYFYFLISEIKITNSATYLILEKFIPGRCIVPEWTCPGRWTFCPIPGLSRAIRDTWSPYGPALCGRPHRKLKLESTDVILCSSNAKKLASFIPEFRLWTEKKWKSFCDRN